MQSNEQRYNDQVQQDDFFDADLTDAHLKIQHQDSTTSPETRYKITQPHPVDNMAQRFMRSLQQIETTGDIESLVALFAEDADLSNLVIQQPLQGQQSIRQFWQHYLSVFERIQSHFTHWSEGFSDQGTRTITLEWISEGILSTHEPFNYRGVSILEIENEQVQHFRTYYDSATFVPQSLK